jgi:thioredoxin reductase (NADPH)
LAGNSKTLLDQAHDVIIIGAGPAGLAAAIYTGRGRLDTLVLEKAILGGQILLTDWVENYPGFPDGVVPFELMENFRKQAEKFGAKIETDEVKKIQKRDDIWHLIGSRSEYSAKTVIISTGSVYRKLGIEGEGKLTGRGVSYCATCDGAFFRDKKVAVVGGGDWALTEAIFLTKFSDSVRIIHRRDEFRGEKILQERVFQNEKIEVLWDTIVEKINGSDQLESISLKNVKSGARMDLKLDGFFISIGMDPHSEFVKDFLELNEWGEIKVAKNMSTSQPGIFAAGDVTDACPEQMATAVGTGVAAAIAVEDYLSQYE